MAPAECEATILRLLELLREDPTLIPDAILLFEHFGETGARLGAELMAVV